MNGHYEYPAIRCSEGSPWHKWERDGAIFAYENQNCNYEKEATDYASRIFTGETQQRVVRKAFIEGTRHTERLKRVNK